MCASPALLVLAGWLLLAPAGPPRPGSSPAPNSAADAPEPEEDVRVVLLSRGSDSFLRSFAKLLEAPIAAQVEVMPTPSFRRAAAQAHIRKPNSIAAVQRVARNVHITHVVSITETKGAHRSDRRRFVEVVVARFKPNTTVMMAQRFFMPERHLTATLAGVIRQRVLTALTMPAPTAPAAAADSPADGPRRAGTHDDDDDDGDGDDSDGGEESDDTSVSEDGGGSDSTPGEGRVWLAIGPALAKRVATLASSGSTPPCYCGGGALANTFPGLRGEAALFWTPSGTAVGVVGDLALFVANTLVPLDINKRTITSLITDYHAGVALRYIPPIDLLNLELTPVLGYHAFNFPLSDGPFPGLSYNSLWAAVRLGLSLADGMWNLFLEGEFLPLVGSHDEAPRLGKQTPGLGWALNGGVRLVLPWLEIGLRLRFADYALAFSGQTFLYTPTRYSNVSLDDRMGQIVLMVGSHFW